MIYKLNKIVRDVRVALDQNNESMPLIQDDDIDTLSMEEIIHSKVVEGVKRVESVAPVHLLDGGSNFGDALYWEEGNHGWVLLPDDFMRLVSFRMSDWERTVYVAISADDPMYARQSSRYAGIRGNCQKPVCALVVRPEGRVLEFYSCKDSEAQVVQGVYRPYPKVDCDGGIEISVRCYTAVIYAIAALVLETYGDRDKAAALSELSKSSLI